MALLGVLQLSGLVSSLSDKTLDTLFTLRGPTAPSEDIIIIGVDEESLAELGSWPFPRKRHAELLQRLNKAKVIGFDILFSEPTPQDQYFSDAMSSSPPVILATAHNYQNTILRPPSLLSRYSKLGHIEIILNRNGIARETNVFKQSGESEIPTFAAAMLKSTGVSEGFIISDKPILINYYGPEITYLYLSYLEVLQGTIPDDFFKDRFVLIGAEALGIGDSHITPFSNKYPTPGVEIQATILNNLLDGTSLKKIQWHNWFFITCIGLIGMFLWPGREQRWNWIINVSLAVIIFACSFFLFRLSIFASPVPSLLFLGTSFTVYLVMERILDAKILFSEMRLLDQQLEAQLQRVYTNIPTHFFNLPPAPTSASGLKRHLIHLQDGVKVLSMQHHFIESILREELVPLILWDKHSEVVIIANTTFSTFWNSHSTKKSDLPTLGDFIQLLNDSQMGSNQSLVDINTLLHNKASIPVLDICLTKQGLKKYFQVTMQFFDAADIEFHGVLVSLTDVTEIKELELLKDNIVSIVSHELKLPLTVILGYGEMLADTLQNEEKQFVDEICSQTKRLNHLIENFLDVARIEHNRQEIRRLPLDLIALIKEAENSVLIPAAKKSISIQSQLPFRVTPLLGDYSLLFQALINLLDNGIKFSPENTQITIKLTEEINRFTLCVADQGPGVPSASRGEIFDTFNRGRDGVPEDGFGLGLSFVKQVVQKHNGKLWLEPESSNGAQFCFTLAKNDNNQVLP